MSARTRTPPLSVHALIAGGGPAGLTLAALLGQAGVTVAVTDPSLPTASGRPRRARSGPMATDGRTTALLTPSLEILQRAGIGRDELAELQPLDVMRIIATAPGGLKPYRADFTAVDMGWEGFGRNVPVSWLRETLARVLESLTTVTLLPGTRLQSLRLESARACARLDDGTEIEAALVVGADGRDSAARSMAGIGIERKDYNQKAIVCAFNHSEPHGNVSTEIHKPGGPCTTVPLPGNRSSLVWVEARETADDLISLDDRAFAAALEDRLDGALGTVTLDGPRQGYPLIHQRAERLTAPRFALIAEAAHVVPPIGAQGLNLSLRDADTLAGILVEWIRLGGDAGEATILHRYETARWPDISLRLAGIDRLNRLVDSARPDAMGARWLGVRALDTLGPVKRLIMRRAMGAPGIRPF